MQLRSLRTGLDGSTAHLAHNLLVKDALATMLARARLFGDAGLELTFMDISYEHHAARHPEMHVFSVNLENDLNPTLADMRQEFLRRMLVQDGRMNTFVMRQYLFGARVRLAAAPCAPDLPSQGQRFRGGRDNCQEWTSTCGFQD